jgi:hypothetical protein
VIRHHHFLVGVFLHLDRDSHVLGREVLHVEERRQLACDHNFRDPLDELRLVDGIGDALDIDRFRRPRLRTDVPRAAQANRARPGLVDLFDLFLRIENLAAGRKIRPFDGSAQLRVADLFVVEELDERRADLSKIVRRDVGGHADGDPRRAVHEEIRNSRRKDHRLGLRAVVVRPKMHGRLLDFAEHLVGDPGETAFGVAHRRRAVAVERSEVAGAVDERVAQGEGLRHADERFVERRVAVGMEAAHDVAYNLGAFAVLDVGRQVLLPHRVKDAALHRLQAVANVGQRPRRDDRQGVVEISSLSRFVERDGVDRARAVATP